MISNSLRPVKVAICCKTKIACISSFISRSNMSTVDSKEIETFDSMKSTWLDPKGCVKPLHSMNMLRIPLVRDCLANNKKIPQEVLNSPKPLKGLAIIDVGCGGGILSEPLARLGAEVVGLDASKDLIDLARRHAAEDPSLSNLTYTCELIEDHCEKNENKYDALVASEVVEHVSDVNLFVKHCVSIVKPGGSLFFTTINKTALSWLGAIVGAEYILRLIPIGTHQHSKFVKPHNLQRMLEESNCETKLINGMFYNVLTNTWSWMPFKNVNYALHAIKSP